MSKTSMIITLGLTMAAASFAQNNGTASVNSVDYQSGNSAPATYEAQMPTVQTTSSASVPPNIQAELEAKTDEYHSRKSKAIVFGIIGTGLIVAGDIMMNVALSDASPTTTTSSGYYDSYGYYHSGTTSSSSSSSSDDASLAVTGLIVLIAGIPFQVIGTVNMIHAIVKGSQLRKYEEETGYRLSVKPTLNPRTGQAGMVASLQF